MHGKAAEVTPKLSPETQPDQTCAKGLGCQAGRASAAATALVFLKWTKGNSPKGDSVRTGNSDSLNWH